MAQINWSKLKAEFNKFANLDQIKTEVHRLGREISKFDIHAHLSPSAKERLKKVEAHYQEISKTLGKTQRQVDREVNRLLRQLKSQRTRAEKGLDLLKQAKADITARLAKAAGQKKKPRKSKSGGAKKTAKPAAE